MPSKFLPQPRLIFANTTQLGHVQRGPGRKPIAYSWTSNVATTSLDQHDQPRILDRPQAIQNVSRRMRLPTETRIMILQEVLICPKPLQRYLLSESVTTRSRS